MLGRSAMGGHCVRICFACPVLADAIHRSRAAPPCWVYTGHIGWVTFAVPLPEEEVYRVGVWNYIIYLMYASARRRVIPMQPAEVAELARTCIRSTVARAPVARRILAQNL